VQHKRRNQNIRTYFCWQLQWIPAEVSSHCSP